MSDIREIVSSNIRRLRKSAGLSQQKLADKTGKSLRYINYLENTDSNVTLEVLSELAKGLGVSVATLVSPEGEDLPGPPQGAEAGLLYAMNLLNESLEKAKSQSDGSKPKERSKKKVKAKVTKKR